MSSTEHNPSRKLAGALFDEVIAPCARTRAATGRQAYFPTGKDVDATTYYSEPWARVMGPADFEFPGGGTVDGLIDAVAALWVTQGETALAAMAPTLKDIAEALRGEAPDGDGSVSIFCYTLS